MPKIHIIIEYDGTNYAGWQRQNNAVTVQETLEQAVQAVTGCYVPVVGAGRTDAGVHAYGQSAHFVSDANIPPEKWSYALNAHLPDDIRVQNSRGVSDAFHARKDATHKRYEYHILNTRFPSAVNRNTCWHVYLPLDAAKMNEAVKQIIGEHDFAAFRSTGDAILDTRRTIYEASVTENHGMVIISVTGSGFLYNMVRSIVGTLVGIGRNKRDVCCFTKAFESGERACLDVTAPAKGLFLCAVEY